MFDEMIQIKLAVEGMKAQIVKVFNAEEISAAIEAATQKAVDEFDMEMFIKGTVEAVLNQAREVVIEDLSGKWGQHWAAKLAIIMDKKIKQAFKENKDGS